MGIRLTEICIDCHDPRLLATFWNAALGYETHEVAADLITIGPPPDPSVGQPPAPELTFALVPEAKLVKNRVHLDVRPSGSDQVSELDRLLRLGATQVEGAHADASWIVLTDPEGNEFCLLAQERC